MHKKEKELKGIFAVLGVFFAAFFLFPMLLVFLQSIQADGGISLANYTRMFLEKGFLAALGNSFAVAAVSALITVVLAFFLAYTLHYTNLPPLLKKLISTLTMVPMLLPTITYGFSIIYSFGKQGLVTQLLGFQPFEIYGWNGLVMGYVIYTLPTAFLLVNNTLQYIDKKFSVVSRIMGDNAWKTFSMTVMRPMLGTLAAAFIQSFFLSFTDFGIPASVGGEFQVIATVLYNQMLGSVPNFGQGAVVAVVMLAPSVFSIVLLNVLDRYNIRYQKVSEIEIKKNLLRDGVAGVGAGVILAAILSVFAVVCVVPFVEMWPYKLQFTMEHIKNVFSSELSGVYLNSLFTALMTALFGTLAAYGAALISARSNLRPVCRGMMDGIALVINTIPGMVLGLAFLFAFTGTPLQNTFLILIICNIIHYFSSPYLMMKNSLSKMNRSWETTAMLMGDSWLKTVVRVVTPNARHTILEVFSYYFINAMVTISAVIFLTGARTMVITAKMKELQHYAKFDEIFALSLLLFITNLVVKAIFYLLSRRKDEEKV